MNINGTNGNMQDDASSEDDDIEPDSAVEERRLQTLLLNLNHINFNDAEALRLDTRSMDFVESIERLLAEVFDACDSLHASPNDINLCNE